MKKHVFHILFMVLGLFTVTIKVHGQGPRHPILYSLQVIEAAITEKGKEPERSATPACGWGSIGAFIDSGIYYHVEDEMILIQIHMQISSKGKPEVTKVVVLEDDGETLIKGYVDQDYIQTIKKGLPAVCLWVPAQNADGKAVQQDIIIHLSLASDEYIEELNQSIINNHFDLVDDEVIGPPLPSPIETNPASDSIRIYDVVEIPPSFGKNELELRQYIKAHFIMPEDALRFQIVGRIILTFVVNEDGSLSDVKPLFPVEKQLGYGLEEEGVRMLEQMPRWNPGIMRGKADKVRMVIPIAIPL
jgi:hypothetical protein